MTEVPTATTIFDAGAIAAAENMGVKWIAECWVEEGAAVVGIQRLFATITALTASRDEAVAKVAVMAATLRPFSKRKVHDGAHRLGHAYSTYILVHPDEVADAGIALANPLAAAHALLTRLADLEKERDEREQQISDLQAQMFKERNLYARLEKERDGLRVEVEQRRLASEAMQLWVDEATTRIAELDAALEPFACASIGLEDDVYLEMTFKVGDLRRAAEARSPT